MISRILPTSEWHRLSDTDIPKITPFINADRMQVVVVEDDGRIVGAWAVLTVQHLEGVWIDPEYRGNPRVASRLLTRTLEVAREDNPCEWAMTAAIDDATKRLLTKHLGAVSVPGEMYLVPVRKH